jgi:thiol:disulfide interchange protein DsbD
MDTLKQVTGFLIFATVIWLVSVVALQTTPAYLIYVLFSFFLMGLGAWLLHRWPTANKTRLLAWVIILSALGLSLNVKSGNQTESGLKWEEFSPATLEKYRSEGKNVFVDFTAAWCISCKVNELVVFGSAEVRKKIEEHQLILLKADWTSHDEGITQALAALERSGVPTYAIYEGKSQDKPVLLPEVITPGIMISALDKLKITHSKENL